MAKALSRATGATLIEQRTARFMEGLISKAVQESRVPAKREAMKLIRERGTLSLDAMLDAVVEDHAMDGALFGAVTGAIASLPAYGLVLSAVAALPEVGFMLWQHCKLVVYMAHVHDPKISERRLRMLVALAVLGSVGGEATRAVVRHAVVKGLNNATKPLLTRAMLQGANRVLRAIGLRLSQRGILSKIPLLSIPVNAAACYAELKFAGRAYRKVLAKFHEPVACDCPWCDTSLELADGWGQYTCGECGNELNLVP